MVRSFGDCHFVKIALEGVLERQALGVHSVYIDTPHHLVFGATRGKRVSAVLRALAPLDPRPVFTQVDDAGAMAPAELLWRWQRIGDRKGRTTPTPQAALGVAAGLRTAPDQPVVVAGSLYLVGAVRGMLRDEEDAE